MNWLQYSCCNKTQDQHNFLQSLLVLGVLESESSSHQGTSSRQQTRQYQQLRIHFSDHSRQQREHQEWRPSVTYFPQKGHTPWTVQIEPSPGDQGETFLIQRITEVMNLNSPCFYKHYTQLMNLEMYPVDVMDNIGNSFCAGVPFKKHIDDIRWDGVPKGRRAINQMIQRKGVRVEVQRRKAARWALPSWECRRNGLGYGRTLPKQENGITAL